MRQTFNDSLQAREWEEKVLKRMKVVKSDRWLNKSDRRGQPYGALSEETKRKISRSLKGKPANNKRKTHIA